MDKIWIYDHFDPVTNKVAEGQEFKQTYYVQDTQPAPDYSEVTDILMFNHLDVKGDYLYKKNIIRAMSDYENNWSNLNNEQKDMLIDLYLYPTDIAAITHLMTTRGMSQAESVDYIRTKYSEMIVKDAESCMARSKSPELTKVVLTYLSPDEATDFLNVTDKLNDLYMNRAIKGLNDGSYRAGLFDFIESTHDYIGAGLEDQGYTIQTGTWSDFKTALMDVLRNGHYGG